MLLTALILSTATQIFSPPKIPSYNESRTFEPLEPGRLAVASKNIVVEIKLNGVTARHSIVKSSFLYLGWDTETKKPLLLGFEAINGDDIYCNYLLEDSAVYRLPFRVKYKRDFNRKLSDNYISESLIWGIDFPWVVQDERFNPLLPLPFNSLRVPPEKYLGKYELIRNKYGIPDSFLKVTEEVNQIRKIRTLLSSGRFQDRGVDYSINGDWKYDKYDGIVSFNYDAAGFRTANFIDTGQELWILEKYKNGVWETYRKVK